MFGLTVGVGRNLPVFAATATLIFCVAVPAIANSKPDKVTYQQVLASPDDAKLNLAFARQEIAGGRLQQAAAALERILLASPNWDSVRLFYGFVLYRLDDMIGAKREFELLEGRGLNPDQEASRLKYLALATQKSKSLRFTSRYTVGGRYASNPGRVSDVVAAANVDAMQDDFAFAASSRFRVEADLNNGQGDFLFFQSNGLLRDYFDVDRADRLASRARAGIKLHREKASFSPYVQYSSSWLKYQKLQESYGGGLDVALTLTSQVALTLKTQVIQQDYHRTSNSTIGSRRDGIRYSNSAVLKWRPSDSLMVSLEGTYRVKDANDNGFSYDSGNISLALQKLFGMGRYISLRATLSRIEYEQPDNFYSTTTTRRDDRLRLRAATGAPLSTLLSDFALPPSVADVVAQIGVVYQNQDSSIAQLDIDNFSVDLTFTKRFSF